MKVEKSTKILFLLGAIAILIALIVMPCVNGKRLMYHLLRGDTSVELTKVVVDMPANEHVPGHELILTDRQSLSYLSNILRHPNGNNVAGIAYTVHFYFGRFESFTTTMQMQGNAFSLSMPDEALEEDWPTHGFDLSPPIPGPLLQL